MLLTTFNNTVHTVRYGITYAVVRTYCILALICKLYYFCISDFSLALYPYPAE